MRNPSSATLHIAHKIGISSYTTYYILHTNSRIPHFFASTETNTSSQLQVHGHVIQEFMRLSRGKPQSSRRDGREASQRQLLHNSRSRRTMMRRFIGKIFSSSQPTIKHEADASGKFCFRFSFFGFWGGWGRSRKGEGRGGDGTRADYDRC